MPATKTRSIRRAKPRSGAANGRREYPWVRHTKRGDRYADCRPFKVATENKLTAAGITELARVHRRYVADNRRSLNPIVVYTVSLGNAVDLAYMSEMIAVVLRDKFSKGK